MRARLLVVAFAVAFSACDFNVKRCESNADCTSPGVCSAEGFCVLSDGGTGGGSTGGGGGSTGGGGMTGGGGSTGGGGGAMCPATCPAGYSCDPGGSVCLLRITGIAFDAPAADSYTNAASVQVTARFVTSASVTLPSMMNLSVDDGGTQPVGGTGNVYSLSLGSLSEATHAVRLWANLADAGVSASRSFTVDRTPPVVTGTLPSGERKRDDVFEVALSTTDTVQAGTVEVRYGAGANTVVAMPGGACGGSLGCFKFDMSLPPLDAMEGDFAVTAAVTDLAGNRATTTIGQPLHVTRKRWEVRPTTSEIRAAPAVGFDGTLYVGTRADATSGTLFALHALDGGVKDSTTTIGSIVSVATATSTVNGLGDSSELVYFTANGTTGFVGARRADNLSLTPTQAASSGNAGKTYSAIALVSRSASKVGAVSVFNSIVATTTPSSVLVYDPVSFPGGLSAASGSEGLFNFSVSTNEPSNNVVVVADEAYLLAQDGTALSQVRVSSVNANPANPVTAAIASGAAALTIGQSVLSSNERLVGGLSGLTDVYRIGASETHGNLGTALQNGLAAFNGTRAFMGRWAGTSSLVAFDPMQLGSAAVVLNSNVGSPIKTSPVLGDARMNGTPTGYAVTTSGRLYVFPLSGAAGSAVSFGDVFTTGSVFAHPTLDCNRRQGAATTTTGILYVTNDEGRVSAIIVDSPRLLTAGGAWPKYQRTAGNAGNTSTTFELNPGCP
ncbi:MAG: hypothetical protein ACOZQL_22370 [Myxococcota bacterium]